MGALGSYRITAEAMRQQSPKWLTRVGRLLAHFACLDGDND